MEKTKDFAKFWLIVHILCGVGMVLGGLYSSFSQHSTSPWDWALRIYLVSGVLVFVTLALRAKKAELKIHLSWVKIRYWKIYLFIALMFIGVSATNVIDYSLPNPENTNAIKVFLHFMFTGLLAASALLYVWHAYEIGSKDRGWSMTACIVGGLAFGLSVLGANLGWKVLSIALGELIISLCIATVMWPVINEQLE